MLNSALSHAPRRPRLLMATDSWTPQVNGVSVVTATMVDGLRDAGWDVDVLAPRLARDLPPTDGESGPRWLDAVSLPGYADVRVARPQWARVREAFDRVQPDVVHCATEFVVGRMARIEATRRGIPFTTSYHTDFARYTRSYGIAWLRTPVSRWLTHSHRRAALTFTPSDSACQDLHARGLRRVAVWGRGIDTVHFHPRHRRRDAHEAPGARAPFTFLYVGRLAPEKNLPMLLDAFLAVRAARPDVPMQLQLVGDGPLTGWLRNWIQRNAAGVVHCLGARSRETELPQLYADADAFVFASTTETLGLSVLEAMASGTPVVAVPAGGVGEHVIDGVNGLTCSADHPSTISAAMTRLLDDPGLRLRLGCGARRHAERFGAEAERRRLDRLMRRVLVARGSEEPKN
ncbi:glycosyltransferase family 4 protein [Gemmatimonas sp. UBA7669]|uniref:glycosyltransferase family 4 protein n=1 Tax=Gemmatimonas sp. UBA7669 TaxID=1946568 RepID=UPI0025C51CA4|nr:glycosyltransferase family 1 protein [Gemmatimonas sp. UBA7669]